MIQIKVLQQSINLIKKNKNEKSQKFNTTIKNLGKIVLYEEEEVANIQNKHLEKISLRKDLNNKINNLVTEEKKIQTEIINEEKLLKEKYILQMIAYEEITVKFMEMKKIVFYELILWLMITKSTLIKTC